MYQGSQQRLSGSGWQRPNFRGETVDLRSGPALAGGAAAAGLVSGSVAIPVAALGAAAVGRFDDVRGQRAGELSDKGLGGHFAALRSGRLTAGTIKVGGLIGVGLLAARAGGRSRTFDVAIDAACIAGAANLVNLFDLRPGRALKVAALTGAATPVAAPAWAMLPLDVRERTMLGDCGANAVGAALGASWVRRRGRASRLSLLALITGLTLASEKVSFSTVIAEQPVLRAVDRLGRLRP